MGDVGKPQGGCRAAAGCRTAGERGTEMPFRPKSRTNRNPETLLLPGYGKRGLSLSSMPPSDAPALCCRFFIPLFRSCVLKYSRQLFQVSLTHGPQLSSAAVATS